MTIELAGIVIRIRNQYPETEQLCRAYETTDLPDVEISISSEDIALEREQSAYEDIRCCRPVRDRSAGYLETLAVYRRIAETLPAYDTFLCHGSAIAVDGEAYIFTANSGTGKSTHTRLWRELLGSRAVMVNDDKPLIRLHPDGSVSVCGTPWDGKHHLSTNTAVPLKAFCVLERAEQNAIRRITAKEAYPVLLQQIYRPLDSAALSKTLTLIDRIAASVSFWRLGCNTEIEAAHVAYEAMRG